MLHQNVKAQGFRVLNEDEIGAVCGGVGDLTITAPSSGRAGFSFAYEPAWTGYADLGRALAVIDWTAYIADHQALATPAPPPQPPAGAAPTTPPLPNGYHESPLDPGHGHYMVRDGDASNSLVTTPAYQAQIDRGPQTNWWGVASDLTLIITGGISGAGSLPAAIGVMGGVAAWSFRF
jgi:hypothetical protein